MDSLFDTHAASYDEDLAKGISLSGENRDFFARGRIAFLRQCLDGAGGRAASVMDFGCGTGTGAPLLRDILGAERVIGIDTSEASLELARRTYGNVAEFAVMGTAWARGGVDLVYSSGVLHHVPPSRRGEVLKHISESLKQGGMLSLWENNPWSPAARWVMRRIPFDRDAVMLWPTEARRLLRDAGLTVLRTDFLFIFPHALRILRPAEQHLSRWPLGAQYQLLARKR